MTVSFRKRKGHFHVSASKPDIHGFTFLLLVLNISPGIFIREWGHLLQVFVWSSAALSTSQLSQSGEGVRRWQSG